MKNYIGAKIIRAEPMDENMFLKKFKNVLDAGSSRAGYHVRYPDGYDSWSPKDVFENAYREITDGEYALIKE